MLASFPPSSMHVCVRDFAADAATLRATSRDPMNVKCDMPGCMLRCGATDGQQTMDWIRFGSWPQAFSAPRAIDVKYCADQAVCSEPFTMTALPAKMPDMMGPNRL